MKKIIKGYNLVIEAIFNTAKLIALIIFIYLFITNRGFSMM